MHSYTTLQILCRCKTISRKKKMIIHLRFSYILVKYLYKRMVLLSIKIAFPTPSNYQEWDISFITLQSFLQCSQDLNLYISNAVLKVKYYSKSFIGITLYKNYILSTMLLYLIFRIFKKIAEKQKLQFWPFGKQSEG